MPICDVGQGDLFDAPKFSTIDSLVGSGGELPLFVIGCGRRKKNVAAPADKLYVSRRFKLSLALADTLRAECVILSGKHGIIRRAAKISPYDTDISSASPNERVAWARTALDSIIEIARGRPVTLLAAGTYASSLIEVNKVRAHPLEISAPFVSIDERHHQDWLDQAIKMASRIRDLTDLYRLIRKARGDGDVFPFSALSSKKLPGRGVYIFLDTAERNFLGDNFRIVRIGTHAVSIGSKASLKDRLKNHLGPQSGIGNHRGSVFRRHIGAALLNADGAVLPSWGIGQHAASEVQRLEAEHERRVTDYISRLEVFIIPVDDKPTKHSMRAHVESQLIGLCSEELMCIDKPSRAWLGLHSPEKDIVQSGLWNLRDVGRRYVPRGKGSVREVAEIMESCSNA